MNVYATIMGNCLCRTVQVTTFPTSVCTLIFLVVVTTSTGITDLFNPSSCYSRVGWPTYYDSAKAALTLMEKTHHVNYLQVFNMHGRLIQPSEYCKVLQDALVQMHFMMTHWYFGPKGQRHASDVFVADIYTMWVLTPPKKATGPVMPRKRKFVNMDPMMLDISPRKFRKTPSPWSRLLFFALMKQYLYDVQVKAAQPSFTSVSPKCPQNPSSACDFYTVFYVQHISTYCQTNYHIPFNHLYVRHSFQLITKQIITFLLIFTPSLSSTFIPTYYQTNYHIPFNFYTIFRFNIYSNLLPNKLSHSF